MFNTNLNKAYTPLHNTNIIIKQELIKIKRQCDNGHKHCNEIINSNKNVVQDITQEYFNEFLMMIKCNNYNCCLSSYTNKHTSELKVYLIKHSEKFEVTIWDSILMYCSDDEICTILKNQINLNVTIAN